MFKLKNNVKPETLGFEKKDFDYIRYTNVDDVKKSCFVIYGGSPYIRHSKTSYISEEQLKMIYDWTKKDYIEWEDF